MSSLSFFLFLMPRFLWLLATIYAQDTDGKRIATGNCDEAMTLYLAGHETTALTT